MLVCFLGRLLDHMRSNTNLADERVCAFCICSSNIGNPLFLVENSSLLRTHSLAGDLSLGAPTWTCSLLEADPALVMARRASSSSGVNWTPKALAVSVMS